MRLVKRTGMGLVILSLLNSIASANCLNKATLVPTQSGVIINAEAKAKIQSRQTDTRQTLTVEMNATVANGTRFFVSADSKPAGTITMLKGRGILYLGNDHWQPLPVELAPVCSINLVEVTDEKGVQVLSGTF